MTHGLFRAYWCFKFYFNRLVLEREPFHSNTRTVYDLSAYVPLVSVAMKPSFHLVFHPIVLSFKLTKVWFLS
jgi:hypothetical protein